MASQTYDFALGAAVGASQQLPVLGSRVKLISADYDVTVRTNRGDRYTLKAGQGFTLSDQQIARGEFFNEVTISNAVATANTGRIFIGDTSFDDSRITGNVKVIDDARSRTQLETAFMASALISTAADQTGHLSISNPAGTGKRLIVSQYGFSVVPSAGNCFVSVHVGQAPTMTGDTFVRNPASKRVIAGSSPAASVGELRSLLSATALPGLTNVQGNVTASPLGGMQREVKLTEPIILSPGTCVVLRYGPQAAGATMLCAGWFEFTEEADI